MPLIKYDKAFRKKFWSKVDKPKKGCWNWLASTGSGGYGQIKCKRFWHRPIEAHRVAWELTKGRIPEGMFVLHDCDNRRCCRPSHLFLGTQLDNMQDCADKGRTASGQKHGSAKLTWKIVRRIRKRAAAGELQIVLAREYGVDAMQISRIVNNQRWKED